MPDNLRITAPVTTNESLPKISSTKQPESMVPIDPTKVLQPNTDKQGNQNSNFDLLLNRNSVFSKFLQQLGETPALSQTLQKIVFETFSRSENVHDNRPVSLLMKQLSAAMKMQPDDMLKNLMFQGSNHTKFSGPVFDVLRNLMNEYPESGLEKPLADFLKAFDGYFSISETTSAIAQSLDTLAHQIPGAYGKQLRELADQMMTEQPVNSLDRNLNLLKEKVLPLLSKYVASTNDFGAARDTITLLVHHTARLNISSHQEVVEKLTALLDYCKYELNLPEDKMSQIRAMFLKSVTNAAQKPENQLYDSLMKVLSENLRQSPSGASQSVYKDTVLSLLLDNSVYMPFTHLLLPLNYNGQFLFSEIWIEKDDDSEKTSKRSRGEPKPVRLYLSFDIKALGNFEASIALSRGKADIQMRCPPALMKNSREIGSRISEIFAKNGLSAQSVEFLQEGSPSIEKRVLKRIYERKNVIDVTV
ncbi:hypothetical protein [Caproiciproducens sp. CPB-2]|uniref:hypothetical protein n=1 Tax=Caproiciproducens sp. CPB-2 TaxID=3030017 RepID=UPI0023DB2C89|nr:hypothetical protein [Caproiciproducens sp. CPB-2]MDF1494273.1 hypothetical protein [Caproiciproducens sp. CPB-2]